MKRQEGFTLIESLVAMAILAILMGGLIPGFYYYNHTNTASGIRTDAVTVAQQVLDEYRQGNPASLPSSGSTTSNMVADNRTFSVRTTYCANAAFCGSNTRHITVEVNYDGKRVYQAETVYTQLR